MIDKKLTIKSHKWMENQSCRLYSFFEYICDTQDWKENCIEVFSMDECKMEMFVYDPVRNWRTVVVTAAVERISNQLISPISKYSVKLQSYFANLSSPVIQHITLTCKRHNP